MSLLRQVPQWATQTLLRQRGVLFCWIPVCLAVGIGGYFSLRFEPEAVHFWSVSGAMVSLALLARFCPEALRPIPLALAIVLIGFLLAGWRAHQVAEPVLGWRYYGPVEGRVIAIDRSHSDAVRLTLDQVRLDRVPHEKTPSRVRISLHGDAGLGITPEPGLRVMTTAHLSPPSGPVEPGGFDFQRHAWFAGLGAVGYTRVPLMGAAPAAEGAAGLLVFRIRTAISWHVQNVLAGDTGGFATALTTGDRSAISRPSLDALRASNLAHLLAISGLHMGLLTALVFGGLRVLLALHPRIALTWPTKGIAAVGALIAASFYLALSGGNVATQRAYIMVAVALAALLLGRRALSLRTVAMAAIIVLVLRPEALLGPGFQMSFAATTALVAVFGWIREWEHGMLPRWAKPIFATVVSSAVAGLATAPIAAAHFNAFAHFGLVANLLSVPLMGVLVMPAAVVAAVLVPVGLDWIALHVMGLGLDWILGVAHFVANLEGARGYVQSPGSVVLPLLTLGFITFVLWQGAVRWIGALALIASLGIWQRAERPDVLISDLGNLVGVMTDEGRALSKAKGAGFVARNWLENDGTGVGQEAAAALWIEGPVVHLSGNRAAAGFVDCRPGEIVVASVPVPAFRKARCLFYDPEKLQATGAIALRSTASGWQITTARHMAGDRLWTRWPE
ncbi:MAG: ComEC/Rec2 family competence protein [Pseudomonadota bacterium]